jgi:hypothetical protein
MVVTDSQFKYILISALFVVLMGTFNLLFIGSKLKKVDSMSMGITELLKLSWAVFTSPELIFLNIILGTISAVAGIVILASYIRG